MGHGDRAAGEECDTTTLANQYRPVVFAWTVFHCEHCSVSAGVLPLHLLCINNPRYISALLLSLNTMLHLELPHINVLSKIDLVRQYGKLGEVHGHVRS